MSDEKPIIGGKTVRNILIIILLLLLGGFIYTQVKLSNVNKNLEISRQNEFALAGRIVEAKTKNDKLEFSKGVLVSKSKDLSDISETLAAELKEEEGKVHRLQRIIATMGNTGADGSIDTLEVTNTVYKYADGSYGLKWGDTTYHDSLNFRQLAGVSDFRLVKNDSSGYDVKPLTTKVTNDQIGFNIITGLKTNKDNGMVEIFVRSDYPNFQVTELEGAIIDPNKDPVMKKFTRQKKFTVGGYVGMGVDRNLQLTPQIGVGVGYTLFSF
jgi:hypothetical protein